MKGALSGGSYELRAFSRQFGPASSTVDDPEAVSASSDDRRIHREQGYDDCLVSYNANVQTMPSSTRRIASCTASQTGRAKNLRTHWTFSMVADCLGLPPSSLKPSRVK
jgi:hypothetical protein